MQTMRILHPLPHLAAPRSVRLAECAFSELILDVILNPESAAATKPLVASMTQHITDCHHGEHFSPHAPYLGRVLAVWLASFLVDPTDADTSVDTSASCETSSRTCAARACHPLTVPCSTACINKSTYAEAAGGTDSVAAHERLPAGRAPVDCSF